MNKPIKITFADGSTKEIIIEKINISKAGGTVVLTGKLSDAGAETSAPPQNQPAKRLYIRDTHVRSALVRFLYNTQLCTGAVTRVTDKAWKIYNKSLGSSWLPKNILKWSEITQMFCVVEDGFVVEFFDDPAETYPAIFNPDYLLEEYEK